MRDSGPPVPAGPTGRRRARVRRALAAVSVTAAAGLALAGCQGGGTALPESGAAATPRTDLAGAVLLAVPVELRQLVREYPCGASPTAVPPSGGAMAPVVPVTTAPGSGATMRDLDGADCFVLSQPLLTMQRLTSIRLDNSSQPGETVIDLGLTQQEASSLAALTGGRTGEQLAVVVRGTVLATPTITGRSTALQIADDFSQDDAQRVMRQITGG
jgi:hypothetical protein